MANRPPLPLLGDVVPELVGELAAGIRALRTEGRYEEALLSSLEDQLSGLALTGRCGCHDDFCASVTVKTSGRVRWDDDDRRGTIELPTEGYVNLDVADGAITGIEILFRPDLRGKVDAYFEGRWQP